jgi:hypothetical protein
MGISANDHARTHMHPLGKSPDVTIGERHAAVGPVDRLLDVGVAATEPVDSNLAAERRILGWSAMMSQGLHDGIELRLTERADVIRMAGDRGRRVVEAIEGIEAAVAIDPGDMEYAARRGFIAPAMGVGDAAAADRDIVETGQDMVFSGKHRQGQCLGIHQHPVRPSGCPRDRGYPQHDGSQQRIQTESQFRTSMINP